MTAPAKLAVFAVAVAAAFALGFGAGEVAGPFDTDDAPAHEDMGSDHEMGQQ